MAWEHRGGGMPPRFFRRRDMLELIVGFALGGLAFTEQGHKIGNEVYDRIMKAAKEVVKNEDNRKTEQDD